MENGYDTTSENQCELFPTIKGSCPEKACFVKDKMNPKSLNAGDDLTKWYYRDYHKTHNKKQRRCFFAALAQAETDPPATQCWNALQLKAERKYEEAMEAFRECIDSTRPEIDRYKAIAHVSRAEILLTQKLFREALASLHNYKVLAEKESSHQNYYAQIVEALIFINTKQYAADLFVLLNNGDEQYKKRTSSLTSHPYILNIQGFLSYNAGSSNYTGAIRFYDSAIEIDEEFSHPYIHKALLYRRFAQMGKDATGLIGELSPHKDYASAFLEKAHSFILQALCKVKDHSDKDSLEKLKKLQIEIINEKEIAQLREVNEEKSDEVKIKQLLKRTHHEGIEWATRSKKSEFLEMVYGKPTDANDVTTFQFLRRWNSFTPAIRTNPMSGSVGGGYFFRWEGIGIVIDPGYNFLNNFLMHGHGIRDIDYIFISHAHEDHTADLESILSLHYQYNRYVDRMNEEPFDRGSLNPFYYSAEEAKQIHLVVSLSTFKKFSGLLNLRTNHCKYSITAIHGRDHEKTMLKIKSHNSTGKTLTVKPIQAEHDDVISDTASLGFLFSFPYGIKRKCNILYTGDTRWSMKSKSIYRKLNKKIKGKNLILLARIGGFDKKESDFFLDDPEKKTKANYDNHLGRIGLVSICETLQPKWCIICEFGEEFAGKRVAIANIMNEIFRGTAPFFFPEEIGISLTFFEPDKENPNLHFEQFMGTKHQVEKFSIKIGEKLCFANISGAKDVGITFRKLNMCTNYSRNNCPDNICDCQNIGNESCIIKKKWLDRYCDYIPEVFKAHIRAGAPHDRTLS